jgi:hypothetical protein
MGIQWYSMTAHQTPYEPCRKAGWPIDDWAAFPSLPHVRSFHPHLLLGQQRGYKVRDKRFLAAALAELAGVAQVSFEGDLGSTSLFEVAGASSDEPRF